jgi:hypothetical protein
MRITMLRIIAIVLGLAIIVVGLAHIAFGASIIRGAGAFSASIDSEDRFFGAVFLGYGLGWLLCATDPVRWRVSLHGQTFIFLLGGVARLLSIAVIGWPDPFYVVLAGVELGLPVILFALLIGLPSSRDCAAPKKSLDFAKS